MADDQQIEARPTTLRTLVEDRLRAAIISGRFKPGQRLVERELCTLIAAKTHFDAVLMEGSGNIFVRQTLGMLHNRVTLLRLTSMAQPGRLTQSLAEIRIIHDAIIAGDPAAAREACERHVANATIAAMAVLEQADD